MSQAPNYTQKSQGQPGSSLTERSAADPSPRGVPTDASVDDISSSTVKMSKVLSVEIKGTMAGFSAMGPNSATWKPVDGKQATIFGTDDDMRGITESAPGDLGSTISSLKNATITKATVLQSYNTFPIPLVISLYFTLLYLLY